ncbi:MAG: hypothetical protein IKO41_11515 [Lachnospiraceae bacterium]|nr:hypothetical protein [Lachnospiraceae bacterium]
MKRILKYLCLMLPVVVGVIYVIWIISDKPHNYTEKKSFEYNLYFLELNEEGKYILEDPMCREFIDIKGKYKLYRQRLVLSDGFGAELVFIIDGDSLIYNEKKSKRPEDFKVKESFKVYMKDGTRWNPSTLFLYFKDE